jgi:hypothetical protein
MRTLLTVIVFCACVMAPLHAADPELAGNWIGQIDTNRGPMDIGLNLRVEKGKLVGLLKTAHGDWDVTGVSEKDGQWTVAFTGGGNEGQMIGRITGNKFSGDWKSKMADGTFEVTRVRKKG